MVIDDDVENGLSIAFNNILLYHSKLIGLIPFRIFRLKTFYVAKSDRCILGYSIFIALVVIPMITVCQFYLYLNAIHRDKHHQTIIVVVFIENGIKHLKIIWIYVSQILNHNDLVNLINEAFKLRNDVMEYLAINGFFLDKDCQHMTFKKILLSLVQVLIVISSLVCAYHIHQSKTIYVIECIFTILTEAFSILFTSVYFGSMLLVLQCYRYLNKQLEIAVKRIHNISLNFKRDMKMQMYCDVCDTIDKIANFYDQITVFTKKLNAFISIVLAIVLLDEILCTLSGVINY